MLNTQRTTPAADGASPALSAAPVVDPRAVEDLWAHSMWCVPEVVRSFGVGFEEIARRAGVDPSIVERLETRITLVDAGHLLAECESATGCAHIGLLAGQRSGTSSAGTIGELARHASTVRQALELLVEHLQVHDRAAILDLRARSHREVELAYVIYHPDTPGSRHVSEGTLAIAMEMLRALCGPGWAPTEVTLACDRPADVSPYRACFGPALRFNATRFAVAFRSSWLEQPVSGTEPRERLRLMRLVKELERSRVPSSSERTQAALARLLIAVPPSADRVAELLGISTRTLNRRLAREGTSFKALLEDTRCAMARQLLKETRLPAIEIAAALHYTTPSAFSRAFRGWTHGTTPRRLRRRSATEQPEYHAGA